MRASNLAAEMVLSVLVKSRSVRVDSDLPVYDGTPLEVPAVKSCWGTP